MAGVALGRGAGDTHAVSAAPANTVANTEGGLPTDDLWAVTPDGNTMWVGGSQTRDPRVGTWQGGGLGRLDMAGTADPTDDKWLPVVTYAGTKTSVPGAPACGT